MKGMPYALVFAVAVMLTASCIVFTAPGMQAESAIESSTVEVVEDPPSGMPEEEPAEVQPAETVPADEPITDDDIVCLGGPVEKDSRLSDGGHPPTDRPHREGAPHGPRGEQAPPALDASGSAEDEGIEALGSEIPPADGGPENVLGMRIDPFRETGPRTVTVVDAEKMHWLLYEMLLTPLELTSDIGQTELSDSTDDDADGFQVTEEETSEGMPEAYVPAPLPELPPDTAVPNVILDTLHASQVVADLS